MDNMTLRDFIWYALETYYECRIWDSNREEDVFIGTINEIPEKLMNRTFGSWELTDDGKIGINID